MTTLYRPVLIESAEQAEALPDGTVLIREGHYAYQKGDGAPGSDYVDGGPETAVGWTALVPIEVHHDTLCKTYGEVHACRPVLVPVGDIEWIAEARTTEGDAP